MSSSRAIHAIHFTVDAARAPANRRFLIAALVVVAVAVAIRILVPRTTPAVTATAAVALPPSVLVRTAPLRQQSMSDVLTAFGQVMTGLDVAISFPRAGQVARLLVIPGQRVRKGTPLVTLTSDPGARLAYTQASNAVDFAQGELRRIQELFALQLATQSQVDAAGRALRDARATLLAQQQLGGASGSATLSAPFDGVVDSVSVSQGDRVQPGAVIMQLGHTDVLRVRLGIEPTDSRLVRVGMPVTLSMLDDSTRTVSVVISESQGLVDPKTQLIDAVAMVPASQASVFVVGMHVRATIVVGEHSSFVVPRAAVLTDSIGAHVFQVTEGKARRVNVTPGTESQGMIAITGSVDPHLPIVVLGNYELQDGMLVRVGPS
ncbi:MAG TPA: efflux RND transporter periplasmic adaptor subunit [Gemmatimonadaceae bacterium]|jgi:RND family efflux transporter MFP subunit|nr:efflux RND transporter periplasmic adaptor subunit [Gemmatimonadaceae bacterium]